MLLTASLAVADPGNPVAVRRWSAGAISIETMWDLNLVIDTTGKANSELKSEADQVVKFVDAAAHVLYRLPNSADVKWEPLGSENQALPNSVVVKSLSESDSDSVWGIQLMVDGTSILCVDTSKLPDDVSTLVASVNRQDVIVVTANNIRDLNSPSVEPFLNALSPQIVILNPVVESEDVQAGFEAAVAKKGRAIISTHNTIAVSAYSESGRSDSTDAAKPEPFQIYTLTETSRPMPVKLADLFARMEKSCEASQQVFAKLSTEQMNWKPSNGTHTPRWNTEHMMGRQLLFFSQIYNAIDSAVPPMNLNPKQMPNDYKYAHADWDGAEEARQMQRVSKFTRRFAYLIDDLDVDKRAPGSRWPSLKALLLQMERHYSEHTTNTVKKFDLEDWPQE